MPIQALTGQRVVLKQPLKKRYQYLVYIIFSDPKTGDQKRIDYTIEMEYCKQVGNELLVRVIKHDIFINKKGPSLILEQIASEINKCLFPIDMWIDNTGKLNRVDNLPEIRERWRAKREYLKKEYRGSITDTIFKQMDILLSSYVKFEASLTKDMFWNVFFSGLYVNYDQNHSTEQSVSFPIEPYDTPYEYKGNSTLNKNTTSYNTKEIKFCGEINIPTYSNLYKNLDKTELFSKLEINYDIDKNSNIPVWIKAKCHLVNKKTGKAIKEITVSINNEELAYT